MTNRAYVYRIYPTDKQIEQLQKTFGCCRFVYNQMLTVQQERYDNGEKHLSKIDANNYCNRVLKDKYSFLREVDKYALTNSIWNLSGAYDRFFRHLGGFPKYKSRHKSKKSYTTNFGNNNIELLDGCIKLPKLGKVKAKLHRLPDKDWKLRSVTVTENRDGSYQASVLFECKKSLITDTNTLPSIGLDYKSDGLYIDSNGNTADMPKYYRVSQEKLTKEQRKLSRMIESNISEYKTVGNNHYPVYKRHLSECKNIQKQRKKVARISAHITNQRKDFLHKASTAITKQYGVVCVEDLNMKTMANKGFGNGKATLDNGYGMFLGMLDYKLKANGGTLVKIDRWYPSSQICHCCGTQNPLLKNLSIRKWDCPVCNAHHDRDRNAAININNEGLRLLSAA